METHINEGNTTWPNHPTPEENPPAENPRNT